MADLFGNLTNAALKGAEGFAMIGSPGYRQAKQLQITERNQDERNKYYQASASARSKEAEARRAYWESRIGQGITSQQASSAYAAILKARDSVNPEDTAQLQEIDGLLDFLRGKIGYNLPSEPGGLDALGNAWLNPGGMQRGDVQPEKPKEQTAGIFSGLGSKVAGAVKGAGGALGRAVNNPNIAHFAGGAGGAGAMRLAPGRSSGGAFGNIMTNVPTVQGGVRSVWPPRTDIASETMEGRAPGPTGDTGGNYDIGQVVEKGGKKWKIVAIDEDGEPLVEPL